MWPKGGGYPFECREDAVGGAEGLSPIDGSVGPRDAPV